MKSIRSFLVIALLATFTLISFLSAVQGYRSSMAEAETLFDRKLADSAGLLATEGGTVPNHSAFAYQIWHDDGRLQLRSQNAPAAPLASSTAGFHDSNFSGQRWRVFVMRLADAPGWAMVAERHDDRYRLAERVVVESVLPIVIGLPLAGLTVWFVVGHGLGHLRRLAAELREKRADDLSPLAGGQPPLELAPVYGAINGLLARLASSFERERRFSADAAHELRTPISALKVHLHNLTGRLPEQDTTLARLRDDVSRLSHIVEQILALHRTTPEHYVSQLERLDLHTLASEIIADRYERFAAKGQTLALNGNTAMLEGDRFALGLLLGNLLDNAGRYTPEGGRIEVDVEQTREGVTLAVHDNGPGIAPAERERVFDRFYRVGGDRHLSGNAGCGLGLSIVAHIARLHGAHIRLEDSRLGNGLCVRVFFPAQARSDRIAP
jgi:two-component system sensor histidine kinase QseC